MATSTSQSEARQVAALARKMRRRLADSPVAGAEYCRQLGEHCAPIVDRIVGPRAGAKRIASQDLATLSAIALLGGDVDGRARNAALLEMARAGGVDRRSL